MKFSKRLEILDKKLQDVDATPQHRFSAHIAIICQNWLTGDVKERTTKPIEEWDIDDIVRITDAARYKK